ncbi:hypothetical protein BE04_30230 [Sorangium cellulosum]|uniref:Uncharacterized protein n=3 Tax=Sorangium cellulosum TaxID=56 RepID=A0A150QAW1_SORCE|nr:hypothetical protein [Sorangium cellulosum]AGP34703.1 hypothetical protein SCE1572_09400 [Sorangium cellulosum So0157-2]KYF65063.1 hypothetical protein BE04_30230 [Sorangium cellulosum]
MKKQRIEDQSWLYVDYRGVMRSYELGKGLMLYVCRGLQIGEFAPHVIADGERQIQQFQRCIYMVDALDSPRMDTDFRDQMTEWLKKNCPRAEAHLLIRSRLLQMAVNVANLLIGASMTHAYSDVAAWEGVGRRTIPWFRRRPLVVPDDVGEPRASS